MREAYLKVLSKCGRSYGGGKGPLYQDPTLFRVNQVDPHVPLLVCETKRECLKVIESKGLDRANENAPAKPYASQWVKLLADSEAPSPRPFALFNSPLDVPADVTSIVFDKELPVPMNWEVAQELKEVLPIYTNVWYPWQRRGLGPCKFLSYAIPEEGNFTGVYKFGLELDSTWVNQLQKGAREAFLTLHGVASGVKVYVNGKYVGYGQDSMTESEFNISSYLDLQAPAENVVHVVVFKWTDGSYLEDQDQWWVSGIFRDVVVQCRPKDGIRDYSVDASPEKDGSANVRIQVLTGSDPARPKRLVSTLIDGRSFEVVCTNALSVAENETSTSFTLAIPDAKLWCPKDPHLYHLILELTSKDGKAIQAETCTVGVRKVEVKGGQVFVNDEPLLVCGVNRHEHDPKTLKVISEASMIKDIQVMKQHNFNAVRCCHYPNAHRWYELCDEMGLYVVDEANMETHGFALGAAFSLLQVDSIWKEQIVWRTKAMVHRARNHPSIIIWSLGNESGCGPNTRAAAELLRSIDDSRPVQYEGGMKNGGSPLILGDGQDPNVTDIICPMYHDPQQIAKTVKGDKRPLILCEYSHAMGNSNGGLHLYWDLFRSKDHPQLQGGFIWDFVDQGLCLPGYLSGTYGYGGDFGENSGKMDSTFCINGLIWPDRTCHPAMLEAKYLQQPLRIDVVSLGGVKVKVTVTPDTNECPPFNTLELRLFKMTASQALSKPFFVEDLNGASFVRSVDIPGTANEGVWIRAEVVLKEATPYAAKGHAIALEGLEVAPAEVPLGLPASESATFNVESTKKELQITSASYQAKFNLLLGEIEELNAADGTPLLGSTVEHCFYRACTDNDLGGMDMLLPINGYRSFASQWRRMGLKDVEQMVLKCKVLAQTETETIVEVLAQQVSLKSFLKWVLFTTNTRYTFTPGSIDIQTKVEATKRTFTARSFPRVGLTFLMPKRFSQVRWQGCGPHECYPDRKRGAKQGVYEMPAEEMHEPYIHPTENGGRCDVKWCTLTDPTSGKGLGITYRTSDEVNAVEPKEGFDGEPLPTASARPAGTQGAQLSVSKYSIDQLDDAKHQVELQPSDGWHVNIDTAHMGLGGDCSWLPYVHPQYQVRGQAWTYGVGLHVLDPTTTKSK